MEKMADKIKIEVLRLAADKKSSQGFAILEAILSMFLMTVGLTAILMLLTQTYKQYGSSEDQQIATLLAQEGIELVRNVRDNNWAAGAGEDSFEGLLFAGESGDRGRIDINDDHIPDNRYNDNIDQKKLYLNSDGLYVHDPPGGEETKFLRNIYLFENGERLTVRSMVVWDRDDFPSATNCTASNKCSFSTTVLTKWGETTP
ncbi:MAG: hypothetical protein QG620_596 [Patescibacteria group bacterium]|nr:hypothetical protein [Patescibacteria group bacterium]